MVHAALLKVVIAARVYSQLMCAIALSHAAAQSYFKDLHEISVKSSCEETTLCQHLWK